MREEKERDRRDREEEGRKREEDRRGKEKKGREEKESNKGEKMFCMQNIQAYSPLLQK